MSVMLRVVRTTGAVLISLVLGVSLALAAAPAYANDAYLELYAPPIDKKKHEIAVLTDLPTGTTFDVLVNGKPKGVAALKELGEFGVIYYQKSWGLGNLQLRYGDTTSAKARLSLAVDLSKYEMRRVGPGANKLRAKITAKRFNAAKGKWIKAPKTTLEVKKKGKWKTVRKIKLNKKGKGKVTIKAPRAQNYRFVVKKTKKNARTITKVKGKI